MHNMGFDSKDEKSMMENPTRWPCMYLPVKRRVKKRFGSDTMQVGILNGNGPTVYTISMFDSKWAGYKFEEMPKIEYDSFDAIVEDGWIVD